MSERARGRIRERRLFLESWDALTERERAVMLGIAKGAMPGQIAQQLGIGSRTVGTYRRRALLKLRLEGTAAIAVAAYKAGLLQ